MKAFVFIFVVLSGVAMSNCISMHAVNDVYIDSRGNLENSHSANGDDWGYSGTWADAVDFCRNIVVSPGEKPWRLPNIHEQLSYIQIASNYYNSSEMEDSEGCYDYVRGWTSTSSPVDPVNKAYYFINVRYEFDENHDMLSIKILDKSEDGHYRCVRDME